MELDGLVYGLVTRDLDQSALNNILFWLKQFELPDNPQNDFSRFCVRLLTFGEGIPDFSERMKVYAKTTICGYVWNAGYVSYKCHTCSSVSTMALCGKCFLAGNHLDHDYTMTKGTSGGACDCGDEALLSPSGFCPKHQENSCSNVPDPPDKLFSIAVFVLSYLVEELLASAQPRIHASKVSSILMFAEALAQLAEVDLYRRIIADHILRCPGPENTESSLNYGVNVIVQTLISIFFHPHLSLLVLNLVPYMKFKVAVARSFAHTQLNMAELLLEDHCPDRLVQMMNHITVQLYSSHKLGLLVVMEENFFSSLIQALEKLMLHQHSYLQVNGQSTLHAVAKVPRKVEGDHWVVCCDLIPILGHRNMIKVLLTQFWNDVQKYISVISHLQGMLVIRHSVSLPTEIPVSTSTLLTELDAVASPMVLICRGLVEVDSDTKKTFMFKIIQCLADQLKYMHNDLKVPYELAANEVVFNLPIHRSLAFFLCTALKDFNIDRNEIECLDAEFLKFIQYPLANLLMSYELRSGLWPTDDFRIFNLYTTYLSSVFSPALANLDLAFIQVALMIGPAEEAFDQLYKRVDSCMRRVLSTVHDTEQSFFETRKLEQIMLNLLQVLLTHCPKTSGADCIQDKHHMIIWLSQNDCPLSDLVQSVSRLLDFHLSRPAIRQTVSEIAQVYMPSSDGLLPPQQQIRLKESALEDEFDPVIMDFYSPRRSTVNKAMTQYCNIKQRKVHKDIYYWPPLRIKPLPAPIRPMLRLLNSRKLLDLLVKILVEINKDDDPERHPCFPSVVHLFLIALENSEFLLSFDDAKYGFVGELHSLNPKMEGTATRRSTNSVVQLLHSIYEKVLRIRDLKIGRISFKETFDCIYYLNLVFEHMFKLVPNYPGFVVPQNNPDEPTTSTDIEIRKKMANEARHRMLDEMKDLTQSANHMIASSSVDEEGPVCLICQTNAESGQLGVLVDVVNSSALHRRLVHDPVLPQDFPQVSMFCDYQKLASYRLLVPPHLSPFGSTPAVALRSCGHKLHAECFMSYKSHLESKNTNNILKCPACSRECYSCLIAPEPDESEHQPLTNIKEDLKSSRNYLNNTVQSATVSLPAVITDPETLISIKTLFVSESPDKGSLLVRLLPLIKRTIDIELMCQDEYPQLPSSNKVTRPAIMFGRSICDTESEAAVRLLRGLMLFQENQNQPDRNLIFADTSCCLLYFSLCKVITPNQACFIYISLLLLLLKQIQVSCQLISSPLGLTSRSAIDSLGLSKHYTLFLSEALERFPKEPKPVPDMDCEQVKRRVEELFEDAKVAHLRFSAFCYSALFGDKESGLSENCATYYGCDNFYIDNMEQDLLPPGELCATIQHWLRGLKPSDMPSVMIDFPYHLSWKAGKLAELPKDYVQLLESSLALPCSKCEDPSEYPVICLLCGKYVCNSPLNKCSDSSFSNNWTLAVKEHNRKCGIGCTFFMVVQSTRVVTCFRKFFHYWGSLYLNEFGEEDQDFRKGYPLTLSEQRLALLRKIWLMHSVTTPKEEWVLDI